MDEHTAVLLSGWLRAITTTAKVEPRGRHGHDDWTILITAPSGESQVVIYNAEAQIVPSHKETKEPPRT